MNQSLFGLFALIGVLVAGFSAPALAKSFTGGQTNEYSAQASRPHITVYPRQVYPGRNAKRQCRATLVKEYRVSGPVFAPHTRCWWE